MGNFQLPQVGSFALPLTPGRAASSFSLDLPVLEAARAEFESKKGYYTLVVRDPDGNELFFPLSGGLPAGSLTARCASD
jgi:hypothetical protein